MLGSMDKMDLRELDAESMLKVKQVWSSFGNLWAEGSARSMDFVTKALMDELNVEYDVAFGYLRDYEKDLKRKPSFQTSVILKEKETPTPEVGNFLTQESSDDLPSTRQELVDILVKIKYAQERSVLYDEDMNIDSIDAESIRVAHPRLYQIAVKEAQTMMKGVDNQNTMAILKTVNKGLVKDILHSLSEGGPMSATGMMRHLGKKYANWHKRISNVLQWLVSQNLIYRVGATRFAFGGYDEVEEVEGLGALEKRVLNEFEEGSEMTSTQLYRKLSCINHARRRDDIDKSVDILILKGFLIRGAYRRLHRVQA